MPHLFVSQQTNGFENLFHHLCLSKTVCSALPACRGASLRSADQTGRADVVGKEQDRRSFFASLGVYCFYFSDAA
jgi:hypothetical protein